MTTLATLRTVSDALVAIAETDADWRLINDLSAAIKIVAAQEEFVKKLRAAYADEMAALICHPRVRIAPPENDA